MLIRIPYPTPPATPQVVYVRDSGSFTVPAGKTSMDLDMIAPGTGYDASTSRCGAGGGRVLITGIPVVPGTTYNLSSTAPIPGNIQVVGVANFVGNSGSTPGSYLALDAGGPASGRPYTLFQGGAGDTSTGGGAAGLSGAGHAGQPSGDALAGSGNTVRVDTVSGATMKSADGSITTMTAPNYGGGFGGANTSAGCIAAIFS